MIDIEDLDPAAVLAKLVNNIPSTDPDPAAYKDMNIEAAKLELSNNLNGYFDYVWGRPLKVRFEGTHLIPSFSSDGQQIWNAVEDLRKTSSIFKTGLSKNDLKRRKRKGKKDRHK